jgi:hypothetical protein
MLTSPVSFPKSSDLVHVWSHPYGCFVFVLWFPVKPGKCSLSSTSAATTYSAGWKEEEQVKAGEKKENRF